MWTGLVLTHSNSPQMCIFQSPVLMKIRLYSLFHIFCAIGTLLSVIITFMRHLKMTELATHQAMVLWERTPSF